jgi:hypothetical protein
MRVHVGTSYVGLRHESLAVNKRDLLLIIKPDRQVADKDSMIKRGLETAIHDQHVHIFG